MRHRSLAAVLAATTIPVAGLVTVPAAAVSTSCATSWGSLPEATGWSSAGQLTGVRSGRHACFDRLVVDLNGRPASGYRIGYVRTVRMDGGDRPVALRGGARLQLVVDSAAYDARTGRPTYRPANPRELTNLAGYSTFRQVAFAGSFEGQTTLGLGVRARLPFRVFTLAGPGHGSRPRHRRRPPLVTTAARPSGRAAITTPRAALQCRA